jgi:hypothetical protein
MHLWLLHYMHSIICHCLIFAFFVVDPMEQEPEELTELAPVKETNPEQEQCKPRCI